MERKNNTTPCMLCNRMKTAGHAKCLHCGKVLFDVDIISRDDMIRLLNDELKKMDNMSIAAIWNYSVSDSVTYDGDDLFTVRK